MRRALVTGASGQDGWYLGELLVGEGTLVHGLVRPSGTDDLAPGVIPVVGDVRDADSLRAAIDVAEPDEIYHLAAASSVSQSARVPELVADVNGLGLLRLLAAVGARGAAVRVVHAGSAQIFGNAAAPQDERSPIAPLNVYGATKAFAQHLVRSYRAEGMWVASAILFNHESPRRPPNFVTRKISRAAVDIAAGRSSELVLGNLDVRRDWGFAGDYMQAMIAIARHERPDDFVVATGTSHTVGEFVAAAFDRVGISDWRAHVRTDPDLVRSADADELRGNPAKIRNQIGWTPQVDFRELVELMVDAEVACSTP